MEKDNKFRFKFTLSVIILTVLSLALFIFGTVFNILQIINAGEFESAKKTSSIISLAICSITSVLIVLVLANSKYVVKNGALYFVLGFFFIKKNIEEISEIVYYSEKNKLVAFFTDGKYTVILISPKNYERFGKKISNLNDKISFTHADK